MALLVAVLVPLGSPPADASAQEARFVMVQPRDSLPVGAASSKPLSPERQVSGTVGVRPRDAEGLRRFAAAASTPGTVDYKRFLAPGEFRSRYGPRQTTIDSIVSHLTNAGLTTKVSSNGLLVDFAGRASEVERSFRTSLGSARLAHGGAVRLATSKLSLPATIASSVSGVIGLDTSIAATSSLRRSPSAVSVAATPRPKQRSSQALATAELRPKACESAMLAAHGGGPDRLPDPQGLTDQEMARSYGLGGLFNASSNGVGQRVAIFELEPYARSDIAEFSTCYFGLDLSSQVVDHLVNGGALPGTAASGEATLDIEDVLGFAPGASIDVYTAANSGAGVIAGYNQIVQDDAAKTITTSWGLCESQSGWMAEIENTIFQQAAAQGQTLVAASGDAGSNDCGDYPSRLSVDDPASQPFVLAAGGTTIEAATRPPLETTWNNSSQGATGGGISSQWSQSSWQRSSSDPGIDDAGTLASATSFAIAQGQSATGTFCGDNNGGAGIVPCRQVPDVSLQADPGVGAITIYNADWGGWTTVGGTSSSSPLWAAILADIASQLSCSTGLGFVPPRLYAIASSPAARALAFNDIADGSNDPGGNAGLFPATTGFDMATGLGTPRVTGPGGGPGLASLLCGLPASSAPVVTSVSPAVVDGGGVMTAEIHGTGLGQPSPDQVASVQVGQLRLDPQSSPSSSGFVVEGPGLLSIVIAAVDVPVISPGSSDGSGAHTVVVTTGSGLSSDPSASSVLVYALPGAGGDAVPNVSGVFSSGGGFEGGGEITVFGSGFTGASGVTFGGVDATFGVLGPTRISVTVPALGPGTVCAATSSDPVNDVCQVHVVVTGPGGTSVEAPILAPAMELSPGCACELAPGLDEYDYFAAPVVTSVQSAEDPLGFAGAGGGSILTVHGTGLNPFAIEGATFGDPTDPWSWAEGFLPVDSTTLLVIAPSSYVSVAPHSAELKVATTAIDPSTDLLGLGYALSNPGSFAYAGVPALASLSVKAGPSTGGTALTVTGEGMEAVEQVDFSGQFVFVSQTIGWATQSVLTHDSASAISLLTPGISAGPTDLYLCTASGCSDPTSQGVFHFYPPGIASITSLQANHGSPSGGYRVTITGFNLGCARKVRIGNAEVVPKILPSITGCGSTTQVRFTMRSGRSGATPSVSVLTRQGKDTGSGWSDPMQFRFD